MLTLGYWPEDTIWGINKFGKQFSLTSISPYYSDGKASLLAQGCQDKLLMDVAGKKNSNQSTLSFVHIVNDDVTNAEKVGNQENYESESEVESDESHDCRMEELNGDLEKECSDEEFEFE